MAVDFQSGPCMIMLISPVTYDWPFVIRAGGCSLTAFVGATQETAGRRPAFAALSKLVERPEVGELMSVWTSSNQGSGFTMPDVVEFCGTGAQNIALFLQSGSWPLARSSPS